MSLSNTATGCTEDTVRPGLVENKAELVAEFEFDLVALAIAGVHESELLTSLGKSTTSPTFSNKPSETMNLLVSGFFD